MDDLANPLTGVESATRALTALRAVLGASMPERFESVDESWVVDAMADLLHLAKIADLGPQEVMDRAWMHFQAEI